MCNKIREMKEISLTPQSSKSDVSNCLWFCFYPLSRSSVCTGTSIFVCSKIGQFHENVSTNRYQTLLSFMVSWGGFHSEQKGHRTAKSNGMKSNIPNSGRNLGQMRAIAIVPRLHNQGSVWSCCAIIWRKISPESSSSKMATVASGSFTMPFFIQSSSTPDIPCA